MLSGVTLTAGGPLTAVAALFAYGEQGGWWDASDFSTMFQDSAGTTPVTAVGQPVGRINDKSGRGNHRTQATAASRPTLRQDASGFFYLEYDGVDDSMATGSVDFSATDKMTVWAGAYKASDASAQVILELGANSSAAAGLGVFAARTGADYGFHLFGTTANERRSDLTYAAPIANVISLAADIGAAAASEMAARLNGAGATLTVIGGASDAGTGNLPNAPLYIGRRGGSSLPFNGREYQTIIRGAASSDAQIAQVERFIAARMGVALA